MPELPDVTIYVEALAERVVGQPLVGIRLISSFVLRTYEPKIESLVGRSVREVFRVGKRIAFDFGDQTYLVIHLMIAGRFLWKPPGGKPTPKISLATFDFPTGTLVFTEASPKKRASISVVQGDHALRTLDPGGLEPLTATLDEFSLALTAENRTLKRALTQPSRFSGIGNAYSDEILHEARLSPLRLTSSLSDEEIERLYRATQATLIYWTDKLRDQFAGRFPGQGEITAFRPDFAVHGKYRKPCPVCGKPVQRIVYADNEVNYCAICQNEGRVLADRALSRLLKSDWPRSLDET